MIEVYTKTVTNNGIDQPRLYTKIENLHEWEANKDLRATGPDGYRRLEAQITDLDVYMPILVTPDGDVLAGNSRLRKFKDMGHTEVWITFPPKEDKSFWLKYNISANDNIGIYNENGLANLLSDYELNLADYAVDFDEPIVLADIAPETPSGTDSQPKEEKLVTCPNCQHQFKP